VKQLAQARKKTKATVECNGDKEGTNPCKKRRVVRLAWIPWEEQVLLLLCMVELVTIIPPASRRTERHERRKTMMLRQEVTETSTKAAEMVSIHMECRYESLRERERQPRGLPTT
jgi:hypothetical protein